MEFKIEMNNSFIERKILQQKSATTNLHTKLFIHFHVSAFKQFFCFLAQLEIKAQTYWINYIFY